MRAEKPNPQADVWFGAPAEAFDRATKEDLLQPYNPTWAAAVDAEIDPEAVPVDRHPPDRLGGIDRRNDVVGILRPEETVLTGVWVHPAHGDARVIDEALDHGMTSSVDCDDVILGK